MKALTTITTTLATLAITAVPAFAAAQPTQDSGLLVWLFIGFCALIVVGQLVPAVVMGIGMVKGVLGHAENN